jgi:hypothetical protein
MRSAAAAGVLAAGVLLAGCIGGAGPTITVYARRDFAGGHQTLRGAHEELGDLDDEISSFEIHSGAWQLCKRPGFRSCRTTDQSMADLGDWDFDNKISSLRPVEE